VIRSLNNSEVTRSGEPIAYSYVDEAGDPVLFNRNGDILIGKNGCSRVFMLGKLDVLNPHDLSTKLTKLRHELLADPYFAGVPSFDPACRKTAYQFHAKDDLPEVRHKVFSLLVAEGNNLRFTAVVCPKQYVLDNALSERKANPKARYSQNSLYDHLVCKMFGNVHDFADEHHLYIAKRGCSNRNEAISKALEKAEQEYVGRYNLCRGNPWKLSICDPVHTVCLQAADYFLWAVQRYYEQELPLKGSGNDRFLKLLQPQIADLCELHFGNEITGPSFTYDNPLMLSIRVKECAV
jgi:hypothetical protein